MRVLRNERGIVFEDPQFCGDHNGGGGRGTNSLKFPSKIYFWSMINLACNAM